MGRLRTTTDSKSTVVAAQYDALGRQERRFVKRAPDGSYRLDANWQYDLASVSDGAPQPGTLGKMLGAENGAALDLAAPAFERDYSYDAHHRPLTDTVAVAGVTLTTGEKWDPESLTVGLAYDGNYGRIKGTACPSGEVVAFDYDSSIGYPIGESPVIAGGGRDPDHQYRRVTAISSRGQITAQHFLNGVSESTTYDDSTGLFTSIAATGLSHEVLPAACSAAPYSPYSMVKQLAYTYDLFDNLRKQTKTFYLRDSTGQLECSGSAVATASASELYSYDDLQRLTNASRTWTGMTWSPPTTPGDSYAYDDLGNILSKSDYADTYSYAPRLGEPKMPHAVRKVSLAGLDKADFLYDANGNLTSGDGRVITFDDFDRPVKVEMGSVTTIFRYAPDASRYLQQTKTASGSIKTVYYMGKYYERVDWSDGKPTEERTYIGPSIAVYQSGSKHDVRYLHLDRLGSVEAVTSSTGAEMPYDAHSFDAFGKPRARDWQAQDKLHPSGAYTATTEHGFTGHEHLDDTYLIHMNGRVYDYRLGRFLSVDPLVSGAGSQAINPYSYGGNNPLSGTDPTGYQYETQVANEGMLTDCRMQTCSGVVQPGTVKYTDVGNVLKSRTEKPNGASNQPSSRPITAASDAGNPASVGAASSDFHQNSGYGRDHKDERTDEVPEVYDASKGAKFAEHKWGHFKRRDEAINRGLDIVKELSLNSTQGYEYGMNVYPMGPKDKDGNYGEWALGRAQVDPNATAPDGERVAIRMTIGVGADAWLHSHGADSETVNGPSFTDARMVAHSGVDGYVVMPNGQKSYIKATPELNQKTINNMERSPRFKGEPYPATPFNYRPDR